MKRLIALTFSILLIVQSAYSQPTIVKDFKPVCDSLSTLMIEKTSVTGELKLKNVLKRDGKLDFYFTESLSDFPLRRGDVDWFKKTLKDLFPSKYSKYQLGAIYSKNVDIKQMEVASLSFKGSSFKSNNRTIEPSDRAEFVRNLDTPVYENGLSGRNIAVWQSHGLLFDNGSGRWDWQRPCLFQTVEDMYTQSYVLNFLVPMLENAGAYILIPRERDTQTNEVIADNDRTEGGRGAAEYKETGKWTRIKEGFADLQQVYCGFETPFGMGTACKTECTATSSHGKHSEVVWRPEIPQRGEYSVYISYKSLPESTSSAQYTVHHMGGASNYVVNQRISGDTWVYLGTFEFDKGTDGYVSLTSMTPEGYPHNKKHVVTADAVRFGGGMGNIARTQKDSKEEASTSGMPRYVEGARYWLQYAGVDSTIFNASGEDSDYKDDFMCRGDWVAWLSGGSCTNPDQKGKGIPIDLTLGFHSDAGISPDDSIIGTLAIYTYESEGKFELPGGESRMTSREFADIVQSQIIHDIRCSFNPEWSRRQLWNRGYRESRTPTSPSMLLEILSHQNFADMKYGLDPAFQFTVSRAVYKGMLKYLSNRYGLKYTVQPLPVSHLSSRFVNDRQVELSWSDTVDEIEPTAVPTGYILYTRIDDGAFDNGQIIDARQLGNNLTYKAAIQPGHIYSFRIQAFNEGGRSFMSETVSIGMPEDSNNAQKKVLIVNNFDRISGPVFFDTPEYAGFDNALDSGVPYMQDISFIGEMYQNNRSMEWLTNDNPGFGGSHQYYAGKKIAGNNFDYAYTHGKAIMNAGFPFASCSNEAFCSDKSLHEGIWCVDLICGKQVTTVIGSADNETRYTVFTPQLQESLMDFTSGGGHVLVSGAYIATDVWSSIYKYEKDSDFRSTSIKFAEDVLGYRWASAHAGRTGDISFTECEQIQTHKGETVSFHNRINEEQYSVEAPDGIAPRGKSQVFMRYTDTDIPAAICRDDKGYRTVCIGFPIESIKDEKDIEHIISLTLQYFSR